nr:MAG TPA: hypothetical protein [Caudoviricetes sp.]
MDNVLLIKYLFHSLSTKARFPGPYHIWYETS